MIEAAITLNDVTMRYPVPKRYREYLLRPFSRQFYTALADVSLTVGKGECMGVLGCNGAGKTTLLRLMGGLLYPSEGSVSVGDDDTRLANQKVRRKVGYVLNEERSFYWRLTGLQNLEFFGALDNLWGKHLRDRIDEVLGLVGLQDARDARVAGYSCGMRQRLAIARGMLSDPDILILDEPTKSLDPLGAEELRGLIAKDIRADREKTLVIATHDMTEVRSMCERVCVISSGRLVGNVSLDDMQGKIGDVTEYYKAIVAHAETAQC